MIWRRPAVPEYPPTIRGSAEDHATGTTTPLVARRTGETDEDGCEIYAVEIPLPGLWFATGRVGLHFDMVPGRSSFTLQFQTEGTTMTDSNPEGAATHAVALMADVSVWTADDWRRLLDAAATGATVDGLLRPPTAYPRIDGAFLILGPECFTGDGIEQTQDVIMWRGAHYQRSADTARTWIGEAHAAFDQAATEAGMRREQPEPGFWVARASAAAALASAEQARIGNLIAWKQLRQSAPTSALPGGGDAIADEIEAALGIGDGSSS